VSKAWHTGQAQLADWQQAPFETPREASLVQIPTIVDEFRDGTRNALEAGIDGVELHAANGYLIVQFLSTASTNATTVPADRLKTGAVSCSKYLKRSIRDVSPATACQNADARCHALLDDTHVFKQAIV
jgi:hypothetical protein